MLMNTFCHLDRIGYATEFALWRKGISCWADLQALKFEGIPARARGSLQQGIPRSIEALESGNARFFSERLVASDAWRLWHTFRSRACFLDIETTGLPPGPIDVTVVCVADLKEVLRFVRCENIDALPALLDSYDLLVTFNGKTFDLPCLREAFPGWRGDKAHLDLRYPLKRIGLGGGLKAILTSLSFSEPGLLSRMDGWMAPILWRAYRRGDDEALETLKAYTVNDVVHLSRLADHLHNAMAATLPIPLPALPVAPPLPNPHRIEADLVKRLLSKYQIAPAF